MFLFILESIGTSELILIGIIALIFLGPRKLPQIAKKIGKTMAEFRSTTNEFKATWEREVDFEDEVRALRDIDSDDPEPTSIPRETSNTTPSTIAPPEVKAVSPDLFASDQVDEEPSDDVSRSTDDLSDKRNWL